MFLLVKLPLVGVHAQNIWLLGLTSIWVHNLFVLWAFGFPTVGGFMLGRPEYALISSSIPHRVTPLLSLNVSSLS